MDRHFLVCLTVIALGACAGTSVPHNTSEESAEAPRQLEEEAGPDPQMARAEGSSIQQRGAPDTANPRTVPASPRAFEPPPAATEPEAEAPAPVPLPRATNSVDDLLDNALTGSKKSSGSGKRMSRSMSLHGTGRGGGGTGDGIIGLGNVGTIGHGAGGGTGYGYGRGSGAGRGPAMVRAREFNTEGYAHQTDNPFKHVKDDPLSTFSIDVDTASYSNVRRFLLSGQRPPVDAVRVEELINYFNYEYGAPTADAPFSVKTEVASAPWNPTHRLVHIGLKGREIAAHRVPARNLVFLIDVSGSMQSVDKLPLLKRGMELLARRLRPKDHVALAVYAGSSGLVLDATSGSQQGQILAALGRLSAGGSTNGAEGIHLAYEVAQQHFIRGGINRVILATDGDFNVGVTSDGALTRLIEDKRDSGVFLTVLGFGRGNLKDSRMEALADKGNGNYAYIDSIQEARKVLVREAGSTLVTIAKDVKLQVEFNPAHVAQYRLIGYENRVLSARDFNDDRKDAGEIGAGHTVTALYEIVPTRSGAHPGEVDPLKYQSDRKPTGAAGSTELLTVKLRFKQPDGATSRLLSTPVKDRGLAAREGSADFRWSAAVAGFGMLLRNSDHRGQTSMTLVRGLAGSALGRDPHGDRREFLQLIDRASGLGI